jgi:hypothetical protein
MTSLMYSSGATLTSLTVNAGKQCFMPGIISGSFRIWDLTQNMEVPDFPNPKIKHCREGRVKHIMATKDAFQLMVDYSQVYDTRVPQAS